MDEGARVDAFTNACTISFSTEKTRFFVRGGRASMVDYFTSEFIAAKRPRHFIVDFQKDARGKRRSSRSG